MRVRNDTSRLGATGFLRSLFCRLSAGRWVPVRPADGRSGMCPEWRHRAPCLCMFVTAALIAAGCVSGPPLRPPPEGQQETHTAGSLTKGIFVSADEALFYAGILHMEAAGKTMDYQAARRTFETLLQVHPDSKWCGPARFCLALLKEREELIVKGNAAELENAACRKKAAEAATEAQNMRLANEKLRGEAAKVQQENDQLKKDLQRLKDLEIELQNRDRLLR